MKKLLISVAALSIGFVLAVSTANAEDLVKIGSDAVVGAGAEFENVVVIGGDLTVDGTVEKSAVVIGGDLKLGQFAKIEDSAVVILGKIIKEDGAMLPKNTVELSFSKLCTSKWCFLPALGIFAISLLGIAMFAAFFAVFLIIAVLFTEKVGRASFYIERHPWKSLYIGFVAAVLIAPVTLFLIATIIGIPLIPLLFIILSAATLFGFAVVCQLIGLKFFRAVKKPGQPMVLEVLVGMIILGLVMMIPGVACIVELFAWLMGLGATVATGFGTTARA